MIINAKSLGVSALQTDVAIIGGGASGLTLAGHLNRDLIVIEAGNFRVNPERDKSLVFETTGREMNTQSLRRQLLGGAGALWAGRCAALNPVDFEKRDWVNHSGWPITYEDLNPHYASARKALSLREPDALLKTNTPLKNNIIDHFEYLDLELWQYAFAAPEVPIHFGKLYAPIFEGKNKNLLVNAEAKRIETEGNRITALHVVDPSGRHLEIRAKHFVLACGCVEVNRFLLDNEPNNEALIRPVKKWLGHGFHQHLLIDGGQIEASHKNSKLLQKSLNRFRNKPAYSHELGLKISQTAAKKFEVANMSATFKYTPRPIHSPLSALGLASSKLRGREPIFWKPKISIELSTEQDIVYDHKVSLGSKMDKHGRRNASVHWNINEFELASACKMNTFVSEGLKRNGIGQLDRFNSPQDMRDQPMRESLHHMGGARMSEGPSTGVVDKNLTLHGSANLSITGGAVFPTGGHVNPTLTMMALSIKLAEFLNDIEA